MAGTGAGSRGRGRAVAVAAAVVVLAGGVSGCGGGTPAAGEPRTASPVSASPEPETAPESAPPARPAEKPSPCPSRTAGPGGAGQPKVEVKVSVPDRRLRLVRGGPPREFEVSLRNEGRDHACLDVVLTTELNSFAERRPELTVERWDPGRERWVEQDFVVANDVSALMVEGGAPLRRGAERTERWRMRADEPGPVGTARIQVHAVATDVPAQDRFAERDAGGSWFTLEAAPS